MLHLTLNSGKCIRNSTQVLTPQLGSVVRPFLDKGGGSFPFPYEAYRIETDISPTGVAFSFFKGDAAISVCVGTWSAECAQEYWVQIENEYSNLINVLPKLSWATRPPKIPASVPWLATLLLPEFFIKVANDVSDIAFLNTCEFVFFCTAQGLARS